MIYGPAGTVISTAVHGAKIQEANSRDEYMIVLWYVVGLMIDKVNADKDCITCTHRS